MEFKERVIYQLPNGRELFALVSRNNKPTLHTLSASNHGEYELNDQGRLMVNGKVTAWSLGDLVDTGRTAPSDVAAVVVNDPSREVETGSEQNLNS